jgi:hypothetical protein
MRLIEDGKRNIPVAFPLAGDNAYDNEQNPYLPRSYYFIGGWLPGERECESVERGQPKPGVFKWHY